MEKVLALSEVFLYSYYINVHNTEHKMKKTINAIANKLATAGVQATVVYADGFISIDAECDVTARDVLNFERFTGYVDGVEVIIL